MSNTKLKGSRVSNYVRKDGPHKGKPFYCYDIEGPEAEIKKFKESENFKLYPRYNKVTGAPQIHTMYIDPLRKTNPIYLREDGNYTLDQSETREDLGILNALRDQAPELLEGYTQHLVEKSWGSAGSGTGALGKFMSTPAPTSEGQDANLDDVK